jgi:hypothetical protein
LGGRKQKEPRRGVVILCGIALFLNIIKSWHSTKIDTGCSAGDQEILRLNSCPLGCGSCLILVLQVFQSKHRLAFRSLLTIEGRGPGENMSLLGNPGQCRDVCCSARPMNPQKRRSILQETCLSSFLSCPELCESWMRAFLRFLGNVSDKPEHVFPHSSLHSHGLSTFEL